MVGYAKTMCLRSRRITRGERECRLHIFGERKKGKCVEVQVESVTDASPAKKKEGLISFSMGFVESQIGGEEHVFN